MELIWSICPLIAGLGQDDIKMSKEEWAFIQGIGFAYGTIIILIILGRLFP